MTGKTWETRHLSGFSQFFLGALLLGGLLTGCATRKEILGFQEDAHYIRSSLDSLLLATQGIQRQVESLQIQQDRLQEEMVTQSDLRQYKAYMGARMDDFSAQSQMLSAQVNDLSQRLTGVAQRVDEMKYKTGTSTDSQTIADPRELYDHAYEDFNRGNYDLARSGFEEYLRLYSDTELADNALYWIGECSYAQKDYQNAAEQFQNVILRYPKGNKAPAALYKVGLCQLKLKQKLAAISTFQKVAADFPGTPEASQAQQKLTELGAK